MLAKSRRFLGNLRLWALIAGLLGLVVGWEDMVRKGALPF